MKTTPKTSFPQVTIVTPTSRSRLRFINLLVSNVGGQTYPHECLEWLVVGDDKKYTEETYMQVFRDCETISGIRCRYVACDIKGDIGKKRNFASNLSHSKILAFMDDDDIYHPGYVQYSVTEMRNRKVNLVGCRDMLVYYPLEGGSMRYIKGCHVHEGSIVCRKSHWKFNKFTEMTNRGEGASLLNGSCFNEMDIKKVMICVAHDDNTFDKSNFLKLPSVDLRIEERQRLMEICEIFNSNSKSKE